MKKTILLTLLLALFSSCLPEAADSTTSSSDDSSSSEETIIIQDTVDTSSNGDSSSGGTTDKLPVAVHSVFMAGGQEWYPRDNTTPLAGTFLNLQEAAISFNTDGLLKVKIRVKPQQVAPPGTTYCFGRSTNKVARAPYTKLKFDVSLVDIKCPNLPNGDTTTSCAPEDYLLGTPYKTQYGVGPISINSFSEIIDLGQLANQGVVSTAIQISNIRTDQFCQGNGSFCPAERIAGTQDCLNMDVHVQTSFTDDL